MPHAVFLHRVNPVNRVKKSDGCHAHARRGHVPRPPRQSAGRASPTWFASRCRVSGSSPRVIPNPPSAAPVISESVPGVNGGFFLFWPLFREAASWRTVLCQPSSGFAKRSRGYGRSAARRIRGSNTIRSRVMSALFVIPYLMSLRSPSGSSESSLRRHSGISISREHVAFIPRASTGS